jgi:hypothetical protein
MEIGKLQNTYIFHIFQDGYCTTNQIWYDWGCLKMGTPKWQCQWGPYFQSEMGGTSWRRPRWLGCQWLGHFTPRIGEKNNRHLKLETFIFLLRQHDIGWLCSSSDAATWSHSKKFQTHDIWGCSARSKPFFMNVATHLCVRPTVWGW